MKTTLHYDMETCGRCGGTGHYSYNQIDGTVCYGCNGTKRRLTRAAKKAQAAVEAFKKERFSIAVEAVRIGDRIVYDHTARTVVEVERRAHAFGHGAGSGITLTFSKPIPSQFGAYSSIGMAASATIQKAVSGADWLEVVAFARTIRKGITITETAEIVQNIGK